MISCIVAAGHFWLAISGADGISVMIDLNKVEYTVAYPAKVYALRNDEDQTRFYFRNKSTVMVTIPNEKVIQAVESCKK